MSNRSKRSVARPTSYKKFAKTGEKEASDGSCSSRLSTLHDSVQEHRYSSSDYTQGSLRGSDRTGVNTDDATNFSEGDSEVIIPSNRETSQQNSRRKNKGERTGAIMHVRGAEHES